jgi:purine-binding chemotaxis protein CheW
VSAAPVVMARAWCSFRLAGDCYGVELARVQEVLRPQPITRVPGTAPALAGVIHLRGRIVPVVDLRVLLALATTDETSFLIVVRSGDGPVGLLVDAIGDVERELEGERSPALPEPATAERAASGPPVVASTIARPDHLLVVLDLDRVLARAFERPEFSPRPSSEDRV